MTEIIYSAYRPREVPLSELQAMVGPGWSDIIARLVEDLFKLGWDGHVLQVKEKFAGLRFYVGSAEKPVHERIHEAENESLKTCEECGAPGTLREGGWLKTLCDEHAQGRSEAHPRLKERLHKQED